MSSNNKEIYEGITDTIEIIDMEEMPEGEITQVQDDMEDLERQRMQRRRERMAAMRQKKRRQEVLRSWSLLIIAGLIVLALVVWGGVRLVAGHDRENENGGQTGGESQESGQETEVQTGESFGVGVGKGRQYMSLEKVKPPGKNPDENSGKAMAMGGDSETGNSVENGGTGGDSETGNPVENGGMGGDLETGNPVENGGTGGDLEAGNPMEGDSYQEGPSFDFYPYTTERTSGFPEEGRGVYSTNGILIDVETEEILACREPYQRINPASMTKILTLLVAAEHVTDLQDTFTMTVEIADYSYRHGCSIAGFGVGEVVTVEELMYGTILPSGADAAMALAEYVAGSQEAFVEMMNQKLEQLGLSDTAHFTNCVGLYDENHYCTVYDMALILKAATDNDLCRRVLSARKYSTSIITEEQPEGILLSNWFLRRIEDKDTHGEVLCAKTGYVDQSGSCAASLAADHEGREYICVTTGSISGWACIYDHVEIYQAFLPELY